MTPIWFITGASRGLGRSIAEHALALGDKVVATARDKEAVQSLVDKYPNQALALELDVSNYSQAQEAADEAYRHFGRVDILVNNAGWSHVSSVEDMSVDTFRNHLEINFFGVYNVTKAFIPKFRKQQSGHIFQISSIGDRVGTPAQVPYQAAKWALSGFSEGLSKELAPFHVKVTIIEPGPIQTDFAKEFAGIEVPEHYASTVGSTIRQSGRVPKELATPPEQIAKIICFLYYHDSPPLRLLVGQVARLLAEKAAEEQSDSDRKWLDICKENHLD